MASTHLALVDVDGHQLPWYEGSAALADLTPPLSRIVAPAELHVVVMHLGLIIEMS